MGTGEQGLGTGERKPGVSACGAGYPVIPLAKAQRTQSSQREEKKLLSPLNITLIYLFKLVLSEHFIQYTVEIITIIGR